PLLYRFLAPAVSCARECQARCSPRSSTATRDRKRRRSRRNFARWRTSWPGPWLSGAEDVPPQPATAPPRDRTDRKCRSPRWTTAGGPPTRWCRTHHGLHSRKARTRRRMHSGRVRPASPRRTRAPQRGEMLSRIWLLRLCYRACGKSGPEIYHPLVAARYSRAALHRRAWERPHCFRRLRPAEVPAARRRPCRVWQFAVPALRERPATQSPLQQPTAFVLASALPRAKTHERRCSWGAKPPKMRDIIAAATHRRNQGHTFAGDPVALRLCGGFWRSTVIGCRLR